MTFSARHPGAGSRQVKNSGEASWEVFAHEASRLAGEDLGRVLPGTSQEFTGPGCQPSHSVLGHDAWAVAGIPEMRPWQEALEAAFDQGIHAT